MTVTGQTRVRRRHQRSGVSAAILPALLVFSVAASIFLILSDSVQALRVGLVVALWMVTLAAVAVTRFRKESEADRAKVRDLRMNYELQLSREMAARRRHEMTVETKLRQKLAAEERGDSAEQISALRQELGALRGQLELIFGTEIKFDRTALVAQRMKEIEGQTASAAPAPESSEPEAAPAEDVVDAEFEHEFAGGDGVHVPHSHTAGRSVDELLDELRDSEREEFEERAQRREVAGAEQVRF
jgi:hypothetical protein